MTLMTLIFYFLIGLITFVAFLHAWGKKAYDISRTTIINNPKPEVFGYIRQLKKQPDWVPWFESHPNIIVKQKGEDGQVGAALYWKGKMKLGEGEGIERITKIKNGKVLETQLMFIKPYKTLSLSYMAVKEMAPNRTKVVWGVRGVHRFPVSVVMLFYGLEKIVGKELEEGLQNLKHLLERS